MANSDFRLYARFDLDSEATVSTDKKSNSTIGRIIDIGLGGVHLETASKIEPNSQVKVKIELPNNTGLEIGCKVLYCNPRKSGVFSSGLKFAPTTHQERVAIAEFVHNVFQRTWEVLAS